jgi:hypothetical protein
VEQVLPVKNGKIHIQAKLNAPIAPYEYTYDFNNNLPNVFTWPHANAPSFQVQVCNPAYDSGRPGYGYYCGQQLFPQAGNTLDGRLYAVHAYSFDPQIHHVISGTPNARLPFAISKTFWAIRCLWERFCILTRPIMAMSPTPMAMTSIGAWQ